MIRAARQADIVVPVIADSTKNEQWAEHINRSEWITKISPIIITKQDQGGNLPLHLPGIASKCGIPGREDSILLCDTAQGMAAMQLHLLLDAIERKYAADPISPEATAETDQRLQQETAILIAGITNESNQFHRVSLSIDW